MRKLFITLSVAAVIGAASITAFAATTPAGTTPVTSVAVNSSLEKSADADTQNKPAVNRDRDSDRDDYCPGYRYREGNHDDRGGRYGGCWD